MHKLFNIRLINYIYIILILSLWFCIDTNFENILLETDLINDFFINKFDNEYLIYEIIYNGTPDVFLKSMREKKFNFDIREKDWILK